MQVGEIVKRPCSKGVKLQRAHGLARASGEEATECEECDNKGAKDNSASAARAEEPLGPSSMCEASAIEQQMLPNPNLSTILLVPNMSTPTISK